MLDKSVIGKLGICYVAEILCITGIANPILNWDDTRMAWDGTIEIHDATPFGKGTFIQAIPTQVKSHCVDTFNNRISVDIADLKIYKTEQRVLYFVCEISRDNPTEYKLYYHPMLLWDLEKTISENANQKQVTLTFSEFPKNDKATASRILKTFLKEASKQKNLIPGVLSIGDLRGSKRKGNLRIDVHNLPADCTIKDLIREFEQQKPYVYLHDNQFGTDYPIDKFGEGKLFIEEDKPMEISIDGQVLYKKVIVVHSSEDKITYKIGKCISVTLTPNDMSYEFTIAGNLSERINATTLLNGIYEGKPVCINGKEHSLSLNPTDEQKKTIHSNYKTYLLIKSFFDKIHIDKDLECDKLSTQDWRSLIDFAQSVMLKKETTAQFHGNPLGFLKVANVSIFGCSFRTESGLYRLYDFFDEDKPFVWYYKEKDKPTSQYLILGFFDDVDLACVDNLNYDIMCEELTRVSIRDREMWIVVSLILRLLSYYDISHKDCVIRAAVKLSEYIYTNNKEDTHFLNYMQSVKRVRTFNESEIAALIKLRDTTSDLQIKCGCCILLEEHAEFKLHYANLSEEEQLAFSKYPIYNLIKI